MYLSNVLLLGGGLLYAPVSSNFAPKIVFYVENDVLYLKGEKSEIRANNLILSFGMVDKLKIAYICISLSRLYV